MIFKLPECLGETYKGYYHDDFECHYENAPDECQDCICTYRREGGRINPETGRRIPRIIAFLRWGLPYSEQWRCRHCEIWDRSQKRCVSDRWRRMNPENDPNYGAWILCDGFRHRKRRGTVNSAHEKYLSEFF